MEIKLTKIDWIILGWIALFIIYSVFNYKDTEQNTQHILIFLIVWSALMMIKEIIREKQEKNKFKKNGK